MPRARGFTSLLAKQRVLQYIEDHQDKAESAVTFGARLDIEWDAYQSWNALNPSARKPRCNPQTQVKITQWLDGIDLLHVDPLDPDIDTGPIIGTKGQEYKQDLMYWYTKRKDSIHDPILRLYPELNELFHEELGTNFRIQSSLIRQSSITREINQVNATISRLTKNTRIFAMPGQVRLHIQQSSSRLQYLSNARKFIN